jgi:DnaK suppressor protein
MTATDAARRALEERREKLVSRTGKIQRDLRRLPDSDSQERVTETENDQVLERLDDTERAELELVERALQRIESGSYGRCETCGEDIAPGRLEILPETSTCIDCA